MPVGFSVDSVLVRRDDASLQLVQRALHSVLAVAPGLVLVADAARVCLQQTQ